MGRFISQDTYRGEVDDPGQWHLYVYCVNNPINYVDPSGHVVALPIYMFGFLIFSVVACAYTTTEAFQDVWQDAVDGVAKKYEDLTSKIQKRWRTLSKELLKSFAKAKKKYETNETHHIIAKDARRAEYARNIYEDKLGQDIDAKRNKVSLKKGLHKRLHRKSYYKLVNNVIGRAYNEDYSKKKNKKRVNNALDKLKSSLNILNNAAPF